MQTPEDLEATLGEVDGTGYGAYNELRGAYDFGEFVLEVDHVQGDPYASPSELRARVPAEVAGVPSKLYETRRRRLALEDFLVRAFDDACRRIADGDRGSGNSGLITTLTPGQAILPRTTVEVREEEVLARFVAGLPASGRTPLAAVQAREMLLEEVPAVVEDALRYGSHDREAVARHVRTKEAAAWIRDRLTERGLVAFVADGARLPRESGESDAPMAEGVVPFESPDDLRVAFDPPGTGTVEGMGVPEGVTLIGGGGYHGKSTLLDALAMGVYDHVPGDGREFVLTRRDAVRVRAEDGRSVAGVDVSPFVGDVPADLDTADFSTPDASGSTSQAANVVEALAAGASVLLVDEDTAATNLMVRDARMRELVADAEEPITPLVDRVRELYEAHGVSSILVTGASGEYFGAADTVVKMAAFRPEAVTDEARAIFERHGGREPIDGEPMAAPPPRVPDPDSVDPRRGGKARIRARGDEIEFGTERIDLSRVGGIAEDAQVRAIGDALYYLKREHLDGETTLAAALDRFDDLVERGDLVEIAPYDSGEYAAPRRFEVAAALNRLRTLECERR